MNRPTKILMIALSGLHACSLYCQSISDVLVRSSFKTYDAYFQVHLPTQAFSCSRAFTQCLLTNSVIDGEKVSEPSYIKLYGSLQLTEASKE